MFLKSTSIIGTRMLHYGFIRYIIYKPSVIFERDLRIEKMFNRTLVSHIQFSITESGYRTIIVIQLITKIIRSGVH